MKLKEEIVKTVLQTKSENVIYTYEQFLTLFAKFGEGLIGEDEDLDIIDSASEWENACERKVFRDTMRKRLKEMLKIPSNEGIGEK